MNTSTIERDEDLQTPPALEIVRGNCPQCGGRLTSTTRYELGLGYLITFRCIGQYAQPEPTCDYEKTI